MPIVVNVDVMLARRKMRLNELAERVGITPQNLSVLKTGKAKAIRFSTLEKLCEVLECQPGDLFAFEDPRTGAEVAGTLPERRVARGGG
jgi:putative transcriptional regulator